MFFYLSGGSFLVCDKKTLVVQIVSRETAQRRTVYSSVKFESSLELGALDVAACLFLAMLTEAPTGRAAAAQGRRMQRM